MTAPTEPSPAPESGVLSATAPGEAVSSLNLAGMGRAGFLLLLGQALGFGSTIIVSRALGPHDYGQFGLALVFSVYSFQLVQFGIDPLLTRVLARDSAAGAARHLAGCLRQKQWAAALVLILAACWLAFSGNVSDRLLLFLGILDGTILAFSIPAAFDARIQTPLYFGLVALRQAAYAAGALLLTIVLRQWISPAAVLILHAACIAGQVGFEWRWVRRQYGALDWHSAAQTAESLWYDALPLAISAGAWQVACAIGPPSVEWFSHAGQAVSPPDAGKLAAGPTELGPLVVSNQLGMLLYSLTIVPARMVQARLAKVNHGSAEFRRLVWRCALGFTAAGVAVALCCDLVAPWLIALLFGPKYASAAPIFTVDAWRIVGLSGGVVFIAALVCQDRLWARGICEVLALAATIAVVAVFLPTHGAIAAAAAVAVGRAVFALGAAVAFSGGVLKKL